MSQLTLTAAAEKIKPHFRAPGDRFVLFCDTCKGRKTVGYVAKKITGQQDEKTGLGTRLFTTSYGSGNNKGSGQLYRLSDLYAFVSDGLLVFDSISIPLDKITDKDGLSLASTQLSFNISGRPITRQLPYDIEKQTFTVSYKTIFGKLSRDITDTIPVKIVFYDDQGNNAGSDKQFKLHFATEEEKETLKELYFLYKESFPDWTLEQLAKEIAAPAIAEYKNISTDNFIDWLKTLH